MRVLSNEDAYGVLDIIIMVQPSCASGRHEVCVRGALKTAVRTWPGTDWSAMSARLREEDGGLIADWLDDAVATWRRKNEPASR